jgi:uncharacterized 2Fe-2S/4Fe-4S cluster protein (DUF4445 family)
LHSILDGTGNKIIASHGSLLIDALVDAGLMQRDFPCSRKGICKKCMVSIKSEENWVEVLSCQTMVESDLEIDLSRGDSAVAVCLQEGHGKRAALAPAVNKVFFSPASDGMVLSWEELCLRSGIPKEQGRTADPNVLRSVATLSQKKTAFTLVVRGNEVIAAEIGDTRFERYGMAFDIGTTTVAGYLINLSDGCVLATASALNPQVQYGADVISRITYADQEQEGLERLRSSIVQCVNGLIGEATERAKVSCQAIYDLVFVGNPCMHHLFFGILPTALGRYPYQPVVRDMVTFNAHSVGVDINEQADLTWLPAIAGFVGADTIGMLLAHPLQDEQEVTLAVDIGTNGEIVLASGGHLWACSAAAGPAFEGYSMVSGIRAQTGAIDVVRIEPDKVKFHVIGDVKPQGICGSGLADLVAGLLATKHIDPSGGLAVSDKTDELSSRIVERNGSLAFLLVPGDQTRDGHDILVTQKDIRFLQLAKAAIATGIRVLLREAGIQVSDVSKVLLAGAFGLYLKPESIKSIRLLPEALCGKIVAVGNAAGVGAQNALLSLEERKTAQELAEKIRYVELAGRKDFEDLFLAELSF